MAAVTFRESTPAEERQARVEMALIALCRRADTPNSLRIIGKKDRSINHYFRGQKAVENVVAIALELNRTKAGGWWIITGRGFAVTDSDHFSTLTFQDYEELGV